MIAFRHFVHASVRSLAFLAVLGLFLPLANAMAARPGSDGAAIGDIAARLASSDRAAQKDAARALQRYGQAAQPYLAGIREYGSPAQKQGAIIGFALLPMPVLAEDELLKGLGDPDPVCRGLAAHGLAVIGAPAARKTTTLLASDVPEQVRHAAMYALDRMGAKAVPALCDALASPTPGIPMRAAWMLGRLGPEAMAAVPGLVAVLPSADEHLLQVAVEAIERINPPPQRLFWHCMTLGGEPAGFPLKPTGHAGIPTMVKLLANPGLTGSVALRVLTAMGPATEPAMQQLVRHGSPNQRIAAALVLLRIDPESVHALPRDLRQALTEAWLRTPK